MLVMSILGAFMSAGALAQKSAVIYVVTPDGALKWYRHDGAATGLGFESAGAWIGPKDVGAGWGEYTRVFPGGGDIIYAIKADGTLEWRKHRGFGSGDNVWDGPKIVGRGWDATAPVFSGGEGVIYTVTSDGKLWWQRHTGYLTGAGLGVPGAWGERKEVGRGWGDAEHVFSTGGGVIYTVTPDGKLWWRRHVAYMTGGGLETPDSWENVREVGRGWNGLRHVFSMGNGIIYAVTSEGKLWSRRHVAYRTGVGLETSGSWDVQKVVGRGWGDAAAVFALLPFNDEASDVDGQGPGGATTTTERSGESRTTGGSHVRVRRNEGTPLEGRHERWRRDAPQSNQILCRGSDDKVTMELEDGFKGLHNIFLFKNISSRLDSTGAAILTLELVANEAAAAAGTNGANLGEGQCSWLDRPLVGGAGFRIRFETPANGQLNQARHGTPVDTTPTAAERFPDATNIPNYFMSPSHYWIFTVQETGQGYLQATASSHWKRTPGLGDEVKRPTDTRGVRGRGREATPPRP